MTTASSDSAKATRKPPDFIRKAVELADLNALRIALLQATGDEAFARMGVERTPLNGGSSWVTTIAPTDRPAMIERALHHLSRPLPKPPPPTEEEVRRLLSLYAGRPVTDGEFRLGLEQLDFTDAIHQRRGSVSGLPEGFHVLIIGAGFGGVVAAIHLANLGIPYTLVDRQSGIGGTWAANRYPDVRVDIPSHYYQYSFEKHYPWRHRFAQGAEVRDYIENVAAKYGVTDRFQPGVEVTGARWNEGEKRWIVDYVKDGAARTISVNAVISAAGLFNRPHLPAIPGLEGFKGAAFHTTQWPEDLDLSGKRVAVIGTGSTGAQLVPKIARTAAKVTIFQRSPNWVAPAAGYHDLIPAETHWLLETVPCYWNWFSFVSHWHSTQHLPGLQVHDPAWQASGGQISERNDRLRAFLVDYIREKLMGDEALIAKCIPDYAPWTRRMVVDNGWYDALRRDNVELVTAGIDRVEPDGVIDRDGTRHTADIIVLSTGFATENYLWPIDYVGRNGTTLAQAWGKDGARAYLGMTMPDFPNLFILYGPNGQPRSGAITKWLELWARYAVDGIASMMESGAGSIEVSKEKFDAYNAAMDAETKSLIWESAGQSSYYVNRFGRSSVNMPWTAEYYYLLSGRFDPADYRFD
ncbi:NAD(P)/FAD-dependent oxidoreductase [Niveispirillum sp.]|uniref:flavin-containing monooxygenase n=1 Tax=Niveispirillum sp. TaxID=1917217 RepID=UPI001B647DDF|nr:NAD(P)/FAD-dependent oxidoreductase [Niveispirillum sp.]MBP7336558.1 NAD(P)/FAD-dependent oxidoreductase [Niveispirillum sp.]